MVGDVVGMCVAAGTSRKGSGRGAQIDFIRSSLTLPPAHPPLRYASRTPRPPPPFPFPPLAEPLPRFHTLCVNWWGSKRFSF